MIRAKGNVGDFLGVTAYFSHNQNASKMWIDPQGKVITIRTEHYRFIEEHADRYGIRLSRRQVKGYDASRLDGIDHGFFRVNFRHQDNCLIIEGLRKAFSDKIKDAMFCIFYKNRAAISRFEINLFGNDGHYKAVVAKQQSYPYPDFETDSGKLGSIPLVTDFVIKRHKD
jgi:hypothetical protein